MTGGELNVPQVHQCEVAPVGGVAGRGEQGLELQVGESK
jgi:hypothetical protein